MNCDDILELVSSGERDVDSRPEFIEHLKGCPRCRDEAPALLAAARAIRAAPAEALAWHPASDKIVALALDPDTAAVDINRDLAEHIVGCATCSAELQDVRRAEQKRTSHTQARPGLETLISAWRSALQDLAHGPVPARIALVTSLGILVLVYPAYLGLRQLPRVKGQVGDLEVRSRQLEGQIRDLSTSLSRANQESDRLSNWPGPVRLFRLSSPLRGQTTEPSIGIDAAEPYVLVSVQPVLAEPSALSDLYRMVIVDADNRVIWSTELTVEGIRGQMRHSGALIFPIPSNLLAPGEHELRVLPQKDPEEPILQIPFEVVPAP